VSRVADLARSFDRHLRAENKSHRTIETYLDAVLRLPEYLRDRDIGLAEATPGDIEGLLANILVRWKPATASNRYRALRIFYAWLEDEGDACSTRRSWTCGGKSSAPRGARPAFAARVRAVSGWFSSYQASGNWLSAI
jgi:hypothetical protein